MVQARPNCHQTTDLAVGGSNPSRRASKLAAYLDARDEHLRANYDAQVIPRHKLWTNDGWLITPEELTAALPLAPSSAVDRRQRPIPWWAPVAGVPG